MTRPWRWIVALLTLVLGRLLRRRVKEEQRIVPPGEPSRAAENVVVVLLGLASLSAIGFIVVYAAFSPAHLPNELLGLSIGCCFLFIGAAFAVVAKRLVVTEEICEEYPAEHPEEQEKIAEIVHESGDRITRKRLLLAAGTATGGALGAAALTPALSIGPLWDTGALDRTPWRRGVRLVDEGKRPLRAEQIEEDTFYTAFPEGADPELIGSSLVVIRVAEAQLRLPPSRAGWAPQGILAYSKICTHAACAVALYTKPTFPPLESRNALVCPCHYSTFDPFTGGTVLYGPAGRPLPQLPLMIDFTGYLRAAGNFSGRVGPAWWNVRGRPT